MNEILCFIYKYKFLILKVALPLALIILIGLAFLLVGYNLERAAQGMEGRFALEIFLTDSVSPAEIDSLENFLKLQPAYHRLELISRDDALDRMTDILGEDPTGVLGYNPLPISIVFYPNDEFKNKTYLEILKQQMESQPQVSQAVFAGDWLNELENFSNVFARFSLAFLIMVLAAYVLLFQMALGHLWQKYQHTAAILYFLGLPRIRIRLCVYIWSILISLITGALAMLILAIAASIFSVKFISLNFFEPRQVVAIFIVFISISILIAVFKGMKIPEYE